jgi:hypothetical protein
MDEYVPGLSISLRFMADSKKRAARRGRRVGKKGSFALQNFDPFLAGLFDCLFWNPPIFPFCGFTSGLLKALTS